MSFFAGRGARSAGGGAGPGAGGGAAGGGRRGRLLGPGRSRDRGGDRGPRRRRQTVIHPIALHRPHCDSRHLRTCTYDRAAGCEPYGPVRPRRRRRGDDIDRGRADGGRAPGEGVVPGRGVADAPGGPGHGVGRHGALRVAGDSADDRAARERDPVLAGVGCGRRDPGRGLPGGPVPGDAGDGGGGVPGDGDIELHGDRQGRAVHGVPVPDVLRGLRDDRIPAGGGAGDADGGLRPDGRGAVIRAVPARARGGAVRERRLADARRVRGGHAGRSWRGPKRR